MTGVTGKGVPSQIDEWLKAGIEAAKAGHNYAKRKMWALAALHFRQAASMMTNNLDPHLALTVA